MSLQFLATGDLYSAIPAELSAVPQKGKVFWLAVIETFFTILSREARPGASFGGCRAAGLTGTGTGWHWAAPVPFSSTSTHTEGSGQRAPAHSSWFSRLAGIWDAHGCCSWAGDTHAPGTALPCRPAAPLCQPSSSRTKLQNLLLVLRGSAPSSASQGPLVLLPPLVTRLLQKFWFLFKTHRSNYLLVISRRIGSPQPCLSASKVQ